MAEERIDREIKSLKEKVLAAEMPPDLREKALTLIQRLLISSRFGHFSQDYENISHYIDWITNLPWGRKSKDILDLKKARKVLDEHHYGLEEIKERVLEYLAVMKLRKEKGETPRAPVLCLVGLVGTGKTSLAFSIAQAMGRQLVRIPFGGIEDAFYLRGRSRAYPQAEPGQIIKGLRKVGVANPIFLLDEIDRVGEEARSEIMGVLVELLDPEQNSSFTDYFIDYPFDLSAAFFIATANNTTHISQAVLDRLEIITMPSYSDEEKIAIGKNYIFPRALAAAGLKKGDLLIEDQAWPQIVRPLGYDAGVRTLKRNIERICRQVAKKIVEGEGKEFVITKENVKKYLPTW